MQAHTEKVPSTSASWLCLSADRVQKSDLEEVANAGYTAEAWRRLPTHKVHLPVDDISTIAVLSWRWDIDEADHPSRNIYCAIVYARRKGIRHLLVDVVSIDQNLQADALLDRIVQFTFLYGSLPVITAYDKRGSELWDNMRRPWITNEILACRHNPTSIVSLRHHRPWQGTMGTYNTGLFVDTTRFFCRPVEDPYAAYGFADQMDLIWHSGYCSSILLVLTGQTSLQDVSDLKYIMPKHAPLLEIAQMRLTRNDFLLTAALLANVTESRFDITDWIPVDKDRAHPVGLEYELYQLQTSESNSVDQKIETKQVVVENEVVGVLYVCPLATSNSQLVFALWI